MEPSCLGEELLVIEEEGSSMSAIIEQLVTRAGSCSPQMKHQSENCVWTVPQISAVRWLEVPQGESWFFCVVLSFILDRRIC
jgi:hypothetical protein